MKVKHVTADVHDFEEELNKALAELWPKYRVTIQYSSAFSNTFDRIYYSAIIIYQ